MALCHDYSTNIRAYQRMMFLSRQFSIALIFGLLIDLMSFVAQAQVAQQCPPHIEISPCTCSIKKNGLDVICEFTDFHRISRAMDGLKKMQNSIIFYLKLRHNHIPKLQGFVFLGLDIHHLTIHNSSLAVVEETSLSSIGMFHEKMLFLYLYIWQYCNTRATLELHQILPISTPYKCMYAYMDLVHKWSVHLMRRWMVIIVNVSIGGKVGKRMLSNIHWFSNCIYSANFFHTHFF